MMKHTVGSALIVFVALFGWCCIPMPANGMDVDQQQTYECCVPDESSTQQMPDHAVCLVSHDGHLLNLAKTVSTVPAVLPLGLTLPEPQAQNPGLAILPSFRELPPHSFLVTHCHFLS